MVARPGIEPRTRGYEPRELPLLHRAQNTMPDISPNVKPMSCELVNTMICK